MVDPFQRILLLITCLLLSAVCTAQSGSRVAELRDDRIIALDSYLSYWLPDQPVDFSIASSAAQQSNYQPVTHARAPASGRDIWYRFELNPGSYRAILDCGDILFEEVEVFIKTPTGVQRSIAGLSHPYAQWPLASRHIAMPLAVPGDTINTVYLHVRTLTGVQTGIMFNVMSDKRFYQESLFSAQTAAAISGGMLAILLFMAIVSNLILQGRVLIIFLGFAMSILLLQLCHSGYISQWFDLNIGSYRLLFIMLPAMMNVLSLYYCRYLFDMRINMPIFNRITPYFSALYIAFMLFAATTPAHWMTQPLMMAKSSIGLIVSLLIVGFGLRALQLNLKGAGYYLLGVFLFVAIINITRIPNYGLGSFNAHSRLLVSIGALTLMFFFAIATLQKIRLLSEREKHLEKQSAILENQNRVRTNFLISMSHEIRTPINGVLGMAQMLEKTKLDSGQRYYLDILSNAGRSLLNVVNEILDISKLEANKLEIESIYFNLDQVLNNTAEMFGQLNRKPGVFFHYENDFKLPVHVIGDPARLQQILNNLLSNAFKFTDTGQVALRATLIDHIDTDRALIRFEVEDSGIGIPEEALSRLFSPFEQADATTARRFGGSGLGLAISKKIVELIGGTIQVTSTAGSGSRFWADIPLTIAQREEQRYLKMTGSLNGKKIAMVVQFPEFNQLYISMLEFWRIHTTLIQANQAPDSVNWSNTDILYISDMLPMPTLLSWLEKARSENCPTLLVDGFGQQYRPSEIMESALLRRLRQPISKVGLATLLYQISHNIFDSDTEQTPLPSARNITDLHLLVAEDNDVNIKVLQAVFSKNHINAEFVLNGADALARYSAEQNCFDAILMDCEMPVMNGFDATNKIRQFELDNQLKPITIIALTAHALKETRDACLQCGMDDILTKPVSFPALLSRLESLERRVKKLTS